MKRSSNETAVAISKKKKVIQRHVKSSLFCELIEITDGE
jgi:hypothetical protein